MACSRCSKNKALFREEVRAKKMKIQEKSDLNREKQLAEMSPRAKRVFLREERILKRNERIAARNNKRQDQGE